jgi:ABC-type branched-subunit amino acid transport system substrate-binding protein
VRDSVKSGTSEGAIEELSGEKVIAVVGPLDTDAATAAGRRASQKGVPLLSLSPRGSAAADTSRFVFNIVHSAEARARALARYAVARQIKDFAILAPASAYGRAVGGAFADEIRRLGGRIAVTVSYPENSTSFSKPVAELKKPWRAIFIPDQARRLALVAPALAAANYSARPAEEPPAKSGPRKILLLSTAELVDDAFMRSSGRYALGGILAPGFYPDRKDETIGRFVTTYAESFGTLPTSLEAYAYDAVAVVAQAIRAGGGDREQVAAHLATSQVSGLTGTIRFGSAHDRADDGVLFRVEQLPSGEFELRAMR